MDGPASCVFAWGPVAAGQRKLLVTGAAAGSEFTTTTDIFHQAPDGPSSPAAKTSQLIIHEVRIEGGKLEKRAVHDLGSNRLERLRWVKSSHSSAGAYGLIAGSLSDGSVQLWSADALLSNGLKPAEPEPAAAAAPANGEAAKPAARPARKNPLLATVRHPRGNTASFDCHPQGTQLAIAGPDAALAVWNTEDPTKPAPIKLDAPQVSGAKASDVQFNPTRPEILGVTTLSGTVQVWILKPEARLWSQIQANGMFGFTCLAWSPTNAGELLVGTQAAIQSGGVRGAPCAIQMWDFNSPHHDRLTKPSAALENQHTGGIKSLAWSRLDTSMLVSTDSDGRSCLWNPKTTEFVSEIPTNGGGNIAVAWHPNMPLLASAAAIEGKLLVSSMHALPQGSAAPGWLKRPCGLSFGFGGKLAGYSSKLSSGEGVNTGLLMGQLHGSQEELSPLAQRAVDFAETLTRDPDARPQLCSERAEAAKTRGDKDAATVWLLLGRLLQEEPAKAVLHHLGFEESTLVEPEEGAPVAQARADEMAKKALLAGDMRIAHSWLLAGNRVADALVFACVSNEFPAATEHYYTTAAKPSPPPCPAIVALVRSFVVGTSAIQELIAAVGTKDSRLSWKELVAVVASAAPAADHVALFGALAEALVKEKDGDPIVAWLAAGDVNRVVEHMSANVDKRKTDQLEQIVEVAQICGSVYQVQCGSDNYWDLLYTYASLLGGHGMRAAWEATQLLVSAVSSGHQESIELRWRLVNAYWPDQVEATQPYEHFAFVQVPDPQPVAQEAWPAQHATPAHSTPHTAPHAHPGTSPAVPHMLPHTGARHMHNTPPVAPVHPHNPATRAGHGGRQPAPVPHGAKPLGVDPARFFGNDRVVVEKFASVYQKLFSHNLHPEEQDRSQRAHHAITELLRKLEQGLLSEQCRTNVHSLCTSPEYFDEWITFIQQNCWPEYQTFADISLLRDGWRL